MNIFRRSSPGSPALIPDVLEAFSLGDGLGDSLRLVRALAVRKLANSGLPIQSRNHLVTMRTRGASIEMDVWAGEHRPLREIVARDEYGLFKSGLVQPGDQVIDVGANIGIFSIFAATLVGPNGGVIAFEPHPVAFSRLLRNIRANRMEGLIVPINKAASDKEGELSFDPSSLSVESHVGAQGSLAVGAVPLDHVPEVMRLPKVAMMKVDVEGHEAAVLAGAAATLTRTWAIAIEYHSMLARSMVLETLETAGFEHLRESVYREGLGMLTARRT